MYGIALRDVGARRLAVSFGQDGHVNKVRLLTLASLRDRMPTSLYRSLSAAVLLCFKRQEVGSGTRLFLAPSPCARAVHIFKSEGQKGAQVAQPRGSNKPLLIFCRARESSGGRKVAQYGDLPPGPFGRPLDARTARIEFRFGSAGSDGFSASYETSPLWLRGVFAAENGNLRM